jgi:putative ABC transport system permease protein
VLTGWLHATVDARLLGFTLGLCVISSLLFGALPALRQSGVDLATTLGRGRATVDRSGVLRHFLVAGEVALAVVLSTGAGLMARTVWRLASVELGFRPDRVLTMRTSLPASFNSPYRGFPARKQFYENVVDRVSAIPGVISAGYSTFLPLTNRGGTSGFTIEGAPPPAPGEYNDANHRVITADYLQTIGVRLVSGRFFTRADADTAMPVAIVNQAMAKQFWPGRDPLGQRFHLDDPKLWYTIVGVVGDIRQMGLDVAGRAEMYFPASQPWASIGFFTPRDLAIRVTGDPAHYAPAVRQAIWSVDRNQPISSVMPLQELIDRELALQQVQLWLLASFAGLALLLSAIGLYGLLSHIVAQRTRDIGVRMALGAQRSQVIVSVMRQGLELVVAGLLVGIVCAWWQARLMQKLLFGISANDGATFATVALTLLAIGAVACYLPARRAVRIDPITALRSE